MRAFFLIAEFMAYQFDPTKTLILRKEFVTQFKARFTSIAQASTQSIVNNDCFGLRGPQIGLAAQERPPDTWKNDVNPISPRQFAFRNNADKISGFMEWLEEMEQAAIFQTVKSPSLGTGLTHQWTDLYISRAYKKGMIWGRVQIKKNKDLMDNLNLAQDDINTDSIYIQRSFNTTVHADRVGILYTRTFSDLKGITAAMDAQISRILAEGMALGQSPIKIARQITKKISTVGIHRATILARTEVIRAHHLASIQTYRSYGVKGVVVHAEWLTAGDSRVCSSCKPLEGKVFTLDKITPLIPVHPQCRCAALPVVID